MVYIKLLESNLISYPNKIALSEFIRIKTRRSVNHFSEMERVFLSV